MKYLFSVDNLGNDTMKLYSVEATDELSAKEVFVTKFLPHVPKADFDALADSLANGMDIIISYIGPTSQIEEL